MAGLLIRELKLPGLVERIAIVCPSNLAFKLQPSWGPYLNRPENAPVLCVDEKSQIQALDRTQPMLPLCFRKARRLTAPYRRHGTNCLPGALSVHDGTV